MNPFSDTGKRRFATVVFCATRLVPLLALPSAFPARTNAAETDVEHATIADLHAAFAKGTLTVEKLTEIYLARIAAYDKQGPAINSVITLNPKALAEAKALDAERKAGKEMGPLFGIPIMLKDNVNTFDLPTTAGSQLLEGSIPSEDAFVTKELRAAGAIILAKVNMSEFAGGGGTMGATDPALIRAARIPAGFSSMGGQTHNPHNIDHVPSGSSGGTGASIAASFAQFGLGTDTGGSVRGPSSANGIVGIRPTHGLVSRTGIVPISFSFDTAGPMGRSVYDISVALTVMAGIDPADAATAESAGKHQTDYTKFLKVGSLKGARLGVLRQFMGADPETDRVIDESIAALKRLGAVIVDPIKIPDVALGARQQISDVLHQTEFKVQIAEYLQAYTKPEYPKTFDELIARASDPNTHYRSPEKLAGFKFSNAFPIGSHDAVYLAIKTQGIAMQRAIISAVFADNNLDALIYPTAARPAALIAPPPEQNPVGGLTTGGTWIASQTGYPELVIPAGMSKDGLPVTISFVGTAFSEPKILGYGYDFEQATKAIAVPKMTPVLPGDALSL